MTRPQLRKLHMAMSFTHAIVDAFLQADKDEQELLAKAVWIVNPDALKTAINMELMEVINELSHEEPLLLSHYEVAVSTLRDRHPHAPCFIFPSRSKYAKYLLNF